ncbi:MAG: ribosome biogenesis GTP-binding protein YihA/YsxC [Candidatus Zixiibacteriota bacterium]
MRGAKAVPWRVPAILESSPIVFKKPEATFVGSYFALDQLPRDGLPQVAVAGRSNVGKSSLLNQILGQRKLAKVSSTPGRTRSLNFFKVDNRFYLVDLPGYGYAKVSRTLREQWGALIEEYLTSADDLIGMVLLLDARRDPNEQDMQLVERLSERQLPVMIAVTKSDKLSRDKQARKVRQIEQELGAEAIAFSAVTGTGKDELLGSVRRLVEDYRQHTRVKQNG